MNACIHITSPFICAETERSKDVRLGQCMAPPPKGASGPHWQWEEVREYRCGTKCKAEFITSKVSSEPVNPPENL